MTTEKIQEIKQMTPQELSDFKALLASLPENRFPLVVHRLISTVDAERERAERMRHERNLKVDEVLAANEELEIVRAERDVLAEDLRLAAGDLPIALPEPGTDAARLVVANRLLRRERDTYAEQLAGTLALLAETRRALYLFRNEWLHYFETNFDGSTAPMVAMISALEATEKALTLTPPQALAKQQEREGALEGVYQVLSARWALRWHEPTTDQEHAEVAALSAVAAIDAQKGER